VVVTNLIPASQRRRSIAIALGLAALVALFYAVTMVRLQGNVAKRMELDRAASQSITVPRETEAAGEQ